VSPGPVQIHAVIVLAKVQCTLLNLLRVVMGRPVTSTPTILWKSMIMTNAIKTNVIKNTINNNLVLVLRAPSFNISIASYVIVESTRILFYSPSLVLRFCGNFELMKFWKNFGETFGETFSNISENFCQPSSLSPPPPKRNVRNFI